MCSLSKRVRLELNIWIYMLYRTMGVKILLFKAAGSRNNNVSQGWLDILFFSQNMFSELDYVTLNIPFCY